MPGEEDMDLPFHFTRKKVPGEQQQENWNAIEHTITAQANTSRRWRQALLVLSGIAIIAFATYFFRDAFVSTDSNFYETGFAQRKSLTLPDGSKVTLNANSSLRITALWNNIAQREVWLEGEAYFEVEKKPSSKQKFVVHANELDIEVLGTKFNVNTRHEKATVSLEEGKIKLSVKGTLQSILTKKKSGAVLEMKPGDVVKVDTISGVRLFADDAVNDKSGWVRNEWNFDSTSLRDITGRIADVYGYKTIAAHDSLLDIRISGKLRAANINELLVVLQFASRLEMKINRKTIKISLP